MFLLYLSDSQGQSNIGCWFVFWEGNGFLLKHVTMCGHHTPAGMGRKGSSAGEEREKM